MQEPLLPKCQNVSPPKWSQERRLEFIDFRLRWEGRLNRKDLMEFFGISKPQASLDIARYIELAPHNLRYERGPKVYVAEPAFTSVFPSTHPDRYLDRILASANNEAEGMGFVGWRPPAATVPIPGRKLDGGVLAAIITAIRENNDVFIQYQSVSGSSETGRWLSPHALAHDGFRWHVRAYCHFRAGFRDFLIARILEVTDTRPSSVSSADDKPWHNTTRLRLTPNPALSEAAAKVIAADYGMTNGEVVLECREALLFYLLRQLNLAPGLMTSTPQSQQVILKNWDEVEQIFAKTNNNVG